MFPQLKDPSLLETRAVVNGDWSDTPAHFQVLNPASGTVIAEVADATAGMLTKAIDAADTARVAWASLTGKERSEILNRWYEIIRDNAGDLARILTAEMGKP
ncbi:aldehyde dehydrogenase family protein [Pseudogemmobacter sonorensis]|uniref:aldehyde dehydrogenase family protein n=1 Tax=Pseudogemmobacter sonorensis TaxID=2989681 RepID=UPI0036A381B2